MKKTSCDFTCMVPTIVFEENIVSELILITRQKKLSQLVLIAQVIVKNSKVEFHCSTLVTDPDSEISVKEDEVPIYVDILPESEFKQPTNIEVDDFQKNFYRMMEETSNQYNANNIYSLISDVAFINNQLNARISLFCPKSSIEIEEIGTSDAPTVCSIPGATYRFPKDKKFKDPNSIYAIYYGINGIKDPRIYSLSYSIYLQQHKTITAAFNNKLYRITFHENDEFELLSSTFCLSKANSITTRFNINKRNTNITENNDDTYFNDNTSMKSNYNQEYKETKPIVTIPHELIESIKEMKNEISSLRQEMTTKEQEFNSRLEEHNSEIKTLIQAILTQVKALHNQEKSSKIFPHRQICRKPVVPLEIAISSSFESHTASDLSPQHQQKQRQISRSRSENLSIQDQQQANFVQNQSINQNKLFPINSNNSINSIDSIKTAEEVQQPEHQHTKYSANMQSSFEKRRSVSKDSLNTSAPTISSNQPSSQNPTMQTIPSNNSINNSINNSAIISGTIPTTTTATTSNNNSNNSKVNLNNIKYLNSNNMSSRKTKTSALNIENRPDNVDFSSKYSKQSTKFSNQLFNDPSFDISTHIPDSLAESPSKKENTTIPSDFSFLLNNDQSMDTNKFFEVIGMSKIPNP